MKNLKLFSALIFFTLLVTTLSAYAQHRAINKNVKRTPAVIQAHEGLCAQMGGVDVSDKSHSGFKLSSGAIDGLVCKMTGKNSHPTILGGVIEVPKNGRQYLHPLSQRELQGLKNQAKNQREFSAGNRGNSFRPKWSLTVYPPSGTVHHNKNFSATTLVKFSIKGSLPTTSSIKIPLDECHASYPGNVEGTGAYRYFVTCNALVVGSATTYSHVNMGSFYASGQGVMLQMR